MNRALRRAGLAKRIGPQMEKFILFVVLYFIVVQFVFPRLGIQPG